MNRLTEKDFQEVFDEGFSMEKENQEENEKIGRLLEMSVLTKKDTGLAMNVWVDDTNAFKNSHYPYRKRIKFQPNTGNRADSRDMVPMSIDPEPEVLGKHRKLRLNAKDVENLKKFVRLNYDILDALGETITIVDFVRLMRRVDE